MDINASIQEAMQKANAGDIQSAQTILAGIIHQEPRNARAWYLLSQVIGDRNREIDCLKKVLEIEPNSQQAKIRLDKLLNPNLPSRPSPSVPKPQPIIKNKNNSNLRTRLTIVVIGIVVLVIALSMSYVLIAVIQNQPDATQCVHVENLASIGPYSMTCIGINAGGGTLLGGQITNTCSKPITKISLRGRVIGDVGYQTNVTLGQVSDILQIVLSPGATTKVSLTIPNSNFGLPPIPCIIDAQSAYFVK
jgi:hypothetical protein